MANVLSTAKMVLIDHATQLYTDRRTDLDFTEYTEHYENLGLLVQQIDQYPSLGHIITDMESGKLEVLGYFEGEDDSVIEFLKAVQESV